MTSTTAPASESACITAVTRPVVCAKRDDTRKPMCSRFMSRPPRAAAATGGPPNRVAARSEEHTSELQSQSNLVCRLLLEKKKMLDYTKYCQHYLGAASVRGNAIWSATTSSA